jgi:hypothetical protein
MALFSLSALRYTSHERLSARGRKDGLTGERAEPGQCDKEIPLVSAERSSDLDTEHAGELLLREKTNVPKS